MSRNPRMQIGGSTQRDPATGGVAFTNADLDLLASTTAQTSRGIYVGTAGNLACEMHDGSSVTFSNLAAGQVYPFAIRKVIGASTTAAGIILY